MSQAISSPVQQAWPSEINDKWLPDKLEQQVTHLIAKEAHWYEQAALVRSAVKFGVVAASGTVEDPSRIPEVVVENLAKTYVEIRDRITASSPIDPEYDAKVIEVIAHTLSTAEEDEKEFLKNPDRRPTYEILQARVDSILAKVFEDLGEGKQPDLGHLIERELFSLTLLDSEDEDILESHLLTLAARSIYLLSNTLDTFLDLPRSLVDAILAAKRSSSTSRPISTPAAQAWSAAIKADWLPDHFEKQVTKLIQSRAHWYSQVPLARAAVRYGIQKASSTAEDTSMILEAVIENLIKSYDGIKSRIEASGNIDVEYGERVTLAIEQALNATLEEEKEILANPNLSQIYKILYTKLDPILLKTFKNLSQNALRDFGFQIGRDLWPDSPVDSKEERALKDCIFTLAWRSRSLLESLSDGPLDLAVTIPDKQTFIASVFEGMKISQFGSALGARSPKALSQMTALRSQLEGLLPGSDDDWESWKGKENILFDMAKKLGSEAGATTWWCDVARLPYPASIKGITDTVEYLTNLCSNNYCMGSISKDTYASAMQVIRSFLDAFKQSSTKAQSEFIKLCKQEFIESQDPQGCD